MTQPIFRTTIALIVACGLITALAATGVIVGGSVAQAGVLSQDALGEQPVAIYFFWGDGCPHCAAA